MSGRRGRRAAVGAGLLRRQRDVQVRQLRCAGRRGRLREQALPLRARSLSLESACSGWLGISGSYDPDGCL